MQVESSSKFEDPRPGCSRDPAPQGCRRKRRLQRRPAERPNDSSSSSCSPQQQQQQRKSRGKKPSPQKCAQNERSNATFIVRTSPVKEQCESNEVSRVETARSSKPFFTGSLVLYLQNKADSSLGDRPQIQRLRMQLIDKVRTKAPNVQEQVKRAIRMMKLDELEKFDRKTRGQTKFTKAYVLF
ncbi:unnamed protein product [Trichogramma brassicae]|uniref:Uncharacterized protein n=1 Tax=Trichogramma brassicae TaxID=86971 RepID=A0A6H5HY95_9HYME|nr:unnamed protein product [Trichogramma brassicae]